MKRPSLVPPVVERVASRPVTALIASLVACTSVPTGVRKGCPPIVHAKVLFGDGEIDFPPVFAALKEADYVGGLHVELSRHSHDAVETARRSLQFLRRHLPGAP